MGLIELAAVWRPKPGQNLYASGKVAAPRDAEGVTARNAILRSIAHGEQPRVIIFENTDRSNPRAPWLRVMLDDGVDERPAAGVQPYGGQQGGYQQQGGYAAGGSAPYPQGGYPAPVPPPQAPQDDIPW